MPLTTIKDTECFAPNYENGERVALIRYPHAGTFEIPILTVNNKNKEGLTKYGPNAKDIVAIGSKNAAQLSGADFDGDTVQVIPLGNGINVSSKGYLRQLEGFDTKDYKPHEKKPDENGVVRYYRYGKEYKPIKHDYAQMQMGVVSNLITDMTQRGANEEEIARAVKHSMVIIDAEKHELDWKSSERENKIPELIKKYQNFTYKDGSEKVGGASTLMSLAKNETRVPKRQGNPRVNLPGKPWYDPSRPEGALVYMTAPDEKLYYDKVDKKTGKVKTKMREDTVSRMSVVDDAHELSSGLPVERIYADYANELKHLANTARVEESRAGSLKMSPSAKETYAEEVKRLKAALNVANANKPRERQALREANAIVEEKRRMWKDIGRTKKEITDELNKEHQRALTAARVKYGSHRTPIEVTPKEWEAIQAGAISESTLKQILDNSDMDVIRKYATPKGKSANEVPSYKQRLIKLRASNGYTNEEIAKSLGVSLSTVYKYL